MTANQISRGVRWRSAASRIGFIGACLALASACGGTIEETDVDRVHLENGNTGVPQTPTPTAPTPAATTPTRTPAPAPTTPAPTTPAPTTPAAMTPAAMTPAADPPAPPPAADPPAAGGDVSFAADVYPIFTANCAPCHTAGSAGGQSVGAPDEATALADSKRIKDKLITRISDGGMPIGCGKPPGGGGSCLTTDEFDTIKAWVDGGTLP